MLVGGLQLTLVYYNFLPTRNEGRCVRQEPPKMAARSATSSTLPLCEIDEIPPSNAASGARATILRTYTDVATVRLEFHTNKTSGEPSWNILFMLCLID